MPPKIIKQGAIPHFLVPVWPKGSFQNLLTGVFNIFHDFRSIARYIISKDYATERTVITVAYIF